jgi:hypothetical protein
MNTIGVLDRFAPSRWSAALVLALVLATLPSAAAEAAATTPKGKAHPVPVRPAYPPVYPGACLYGVCGGIWWVDRRPVRRPVAPVQPEFVEQDIWGSTGNPWGYVRRLPPPTPEGHIQSRYRDASTIRPEFAERGEAAQR